MYEFWYDYLKPKYSEKAKVCLMDVDSFIFCVKTDDIYKDIPEEVETRFDISKYELERPFPQGMNKKFISMMKDESSGKIIKELAGLTTKT